MLQLSPPDPSADELPTVLPREAASPREADALEEPAGVSASAAASRSAEKSRGLNRPALSPPLPSPSPQASELLPGRILLRGCSVVSHGHGGSLFSSGRRSAPLSPPRSPAADWAVTWGALTSLPDSRPTEHPASGHSARDLRHLQSVNEPSSSLPLQTHCSAPHLRSRNPRLVPNTSGSLTSNI